MPGLVATSFCTFLDRDTHTHFFRMAMVIIATIDVVVSWSESHTLGDKSDRRIVKENMLMIVNVALMTMAILRKCVWVSLSRNVKQEVATKPGTIVNP